MLSRKARSILHVAACVLLLAVIAPAICLSSSPAEAVVYVSGDAALYGDGSSWGRAVRTIQAGIDLAAPARAEVWVRTGTYYENVVLANGVFVYGGFAGEETARVLRSPAKYVTTINGRGIGSVVSAVEAAGCGIDGFTITNGSGTYFNTGTYLSGVIHGGGIYIHRSTTTVANNVITGNAAADTGGGIHAYGSAVTVTGNRFIGNQSMGAYGSGGAIYLDNCGNCAVTSNMFDGNECYWDGGAVHCTYGSSPLIERNLFVGNKGGAGGAVHCNFTCSPQMLNNTMVGNWARNGGGAVSVYSYCNPILIGNLIVGNSADEGGAFKRYVDQTSLPQFSYNDFYDNGVAPFFNISPPVGWGGNFSADPLFVNVLASDYRLSPGSPCVNTGDPSRLDPDGSRSDVGAFPLMGVAPADNPPDCWITSSPANGTTDPEVVITWAGSDDNAMPSELVYSYRFDGGTWSAWVAVTEVRQTMAPGTHKFEVIARDPGGHVDPTPASVTFTIAAPPPILQVSAPTVAGLSDTYATISWTTNVPAYGTLEYGLSTALGSRVDTGSLVTNHQVSLNSLRPDTVYYIRVSAVTPVGDTATSAIVSFRTQASSGQRAVKIYGLMILKAGVSGYMATWRTDVPSTSRIDWGQGASYGSSKTDPVLTTDHMLYMGSIYGKGTYHAKATSTAPGYVTGYSPDVLFSVSK